MKQTIVALAALTLSAGARAQGSGFEDEALGAAPAGWTCGVTGRGSPHRIVAEDTGTPVKVLLQSGRGPFPWCVKTGTALSDGFVEVKFRPIAGREDQAGGVVWRFRSCTWSW
ncbi:hypothetical protein [Aquabacterium sp.]|uniref:hypothetical protein n=1 Tax=Aquabacterium sp. TaxID=1872578 RepID=UPI002CE5039A|nr:hypothetical protein [Aquabacterium sp.]HSW08029.1 hypothetical protein [Aquabacterium sp.]